MIDPTKETLLKMNQAARILGVSPSTMWRIALSGKIETIKVGGSRKTSTEAIRRYAMAQQEADQLEPASDVESACEQAGI